MRHTDQRLNAIVLQEFVHHFLILFQIIRQQGVTDLLLEHFHTGKAC